MKHFGLAVLLLLSVQIFADNKAAQEKVFEGEISDTQCAFNVHAHNRSHEEMIKAGYMGSTSADCTRICVEMGGQLAFIPSDRKTAYKLEPQDAAKNFAGKKVRIEGTLDSENRLHISKIKAL